MGEKKFSILISLKKFIQSFLVFIIPQIGNILSTVNLTDSSVLGFLKNIFPRIDTTIAMIISAAIIGGFNAWKHRNDGK